MELNLPASLGCSGHSVSYLPVTHLIMLSMELQARDVSIADPRSDRPINILLLKTEDI